MSVEGQKLENIVITCSDCGLEFVFSVGEQQYYSSKSLSTPKRCPQCRKIRRESIVPDNGEGGDTNG